MTVERIRLSEEGGRIDRAAWLELRRGFVTASDVPAVCGEGLFGSPARVWAEKRGVIGAQGMTDAMLRGLWGEAAVFEALAWEHPDWDIRRAKVFLADRAARLGATPDGVAAVPGHEGIVVVQCKVVAAPVFRASWLESASDDPLFGIATPPVAYQLQTLTEAMLADAQRGLLAVLVVDAFRWVLREFWVERHEAAEAAIRDRVAAFWRDYLDAGVQPPIDATRDEKLVAALYPADDGSEVDLAGDNELPEIVDRLVSAREQQRRADQDVSSAKTAIAAKLGPHTFGRLADGRRISHKLQRRAGYEVKPSEIRVMKVLAS